jgi:UDP-2,3-diacylglucosamine hydrolase
LPTAIIADAHLGGTGDAAAPLVEQLDSLERVGCERLVLLGDLFQAWVGSRRFETAAITAVVAALRAVRGRGIAVHYIEGNRDFFLAGSPYADAFDSVGCEVAFASGGTRYLAVHGDGLNERDWQYLAWRGLVKSRASRLLVLHTPPRFARRVVDSTERRLSRTNFKHKVRLPEAAIRAYAERRLAEGHDVLLLGHFHEPRTWQVPGGEVRLLDAWFNTNKIEWV